MTRQSLDKSAIKIVLFEGIHANAAQLLNEDGYSQVKRFDKTVPAEVLRRELAEARFIGVRSRTRVTAEVLEMAPKLAAIGCFCIGTNQVDLRAAKLRGIPVFNAPFANTRSVAELVLGEILLLLRGIPEKNAAAHRGAWLKSARGAYEARGKTVGIVGYGHIGTQMGLLAESLGMRVRYYDILKKLALGNAQSCASLEALFADSDIITFHVPETPQTHEMLNRGNIGQLRQGAIVVNASRGTVVEIDTLVSALKTGAVSAAAIDVFPTEPASNQDEFISPLRDFDNVILTPHIGGSTQEAQANIGIEVAEKLLRYSNNGSTMGTVNFPQVALPEHAGHYRTLHIHRNEPGVLSKVNDLFSCKRTNITGQYLQTDTDIGYVVTDINCESDQAILAELKKIPGTIRARILF